MLGGIADEAAERFGDAPALRVADGGWTVSYRELAALSHEVAAGWRHRGIGLGDVVALVLPPGPEPVVAHLAAARIGAVTAGVGGPDPTARAAELAVVAPDVVVTTDDLAPAGGDRGSAEVLPVAPAGRAAEVLVGLREPGSTVEPLPDDPDRPVVVVFAAGGHDGPRGATFSGRQLDVITALDTGRRWGGGGEVLAARPLTELGPMVGLAGALQSGGTTTLLDPWAPDRALDLVERHRVATVAGTPAQIAELLADPDLDRRDLSAVRSVLLLGGPAGAELVREARARFGAPVAVRYAPVEAGIGTATALDGPPEDAEQTVGAPRPGVTLTLVADDGTPVAEGDEGEVCFRSAAVMNGYWEDRAATREAFLPDGSVRTGDRGAVDDRGRLRLVPRPADHR